MNKLPIKPLSVNQAWQGKRFKTPEYHRYQKDVLAILPPLRVPEGKLAVSLVFGLSSKTADVDNPVKCFVDCMQKKYGFNDRNIYRLVVEKVDVKKGQEFIGFSIHSLDDQKFVEDYFNNLANDLQKTLNQA